VSGFARRDSQRYHRDPVLSQSERLDSVGDTETYTAYLDYDDGTSEVPHDRGYVDHVERSGGL